MFVCKQYICAHLFNITASLATKIALNDLNFFSIMICKSHDVTSGVFKAPFKILP